MNGIAVAGKAIEIGKSECTPFGSNGNEVILEITKGQLIRVSGFSDPVARWLGSQLFKNVMVTFDSAESDGSEA